VGSGVAIDQPPPTPSLVKEGSIDCSRLSAFRFCFLPSAYSAPASPSSVPPSVSDIVAQIAIHRGVAQLVAIHASDHGYFFLLPKLIALLDVAVAHRTFDVRFEVFLVAEVNKIRKLVNWLPGDHAIVCPQLNQSLDCRAIPLDCVVAGQALCRAGHLHLAAGSHGKVARVALESCLNMPAMTERNRLNDRIRRGRKLLRLSGGARSEG